MLHWAMIRATYLAMALRDKSHEKLHSLTAPLVWELLVPSHGFLSKSNQLLVFFLREGKTGVPEGKLPTVE